MRAGVLVRTRAVSVWSCLTVLGLAGCGAATTSKSAVTVSGSNLTVYASQPPGNGGGQAATDVLEAERLALTQSGGRVGRFTVSLVKLHGSKLSDNARTAIQDPSAIAYLGELQPGTSQISVEILNQQGLLEISPADTGVYLTQATPAVSGSPTKFYPTRSTYQETFARVVANSSVEAGAHVQEMRSLGVSKLYVASDGEPYGTAIALEVRQAAQHAGISLVSGAAAADAMFYGGLPGRAASQAIGQAVAGRPTLKLFAPSGLYDDAFVAGLSPAAQQNLLVSSPGFLTSDLNPTGQKFVSDFASAYGHPPAPQAIFGYEAMAALLAVLQKAGSAAGNRALVVSDFRSLTNRASAIGTYTVTGGDPSIAPFVFARPRGGALMAFKFVQGQG